MAGRLPLRGSCLSEKLRRKFRIFFYILHKMMYIIDRKVSLTEDIMKKYCLSFILCLVSFCVILLAAACPEQPEENGTKTETEYTVTFDTNGGSPETVKPVTVTGGLSMGGKFPVDPTKTDYKFDGWYDENVSPAQKYDRKTIVTKDVVLKARWTEMTQRDFILREIEETWEELGYTEMPTKYVAMSFDDGPCAPGSSGGTNALLAVLEDVQVKATFFVIGSNIQSNNAAAKAIFEAGHEMGNHSNGYGSLGGSTAVSTITTSLTAASTAIKTITGEDPVLFRAPNLNYGDNLTQVCKDMGLALIDGSAHNDWEDNVSSEAIKNSVLSNPQDGGIILLHENNTSKGKTMAALPDIVSGLRERGFWITTVSQLAIIKEKILEAGEQYSNMN
jgi:uncharacterized repeat protein (TIGR02543 family)